VTAHEVELARSALNLILLARVLQWEYIGNIGNTGHWVEPIPIPIPSIPHQGVLLTIHHEPGRREEPLPRHRNKRHSFCHRQQKRGGAAQNAKNGQRLDLCIGIPGLGEDGHRP